MSILDILMSGQGQQAVQSLGQQFGLSSGQTQDALKNLVPALAGGLRQNAQSSGGLESLLGALSKGNHNQYLEQPTQLGSVDSVEEGNAILGHVLGSKGVSRQVAQRASANTGIGDDVLKKMLPQIANMVMGAMSQQTQAGSGGVLSDVMGSFLGGKQGDANPLDALGSLLDADADADGNIGDDLLGLAGKLFK